jgi:pimeloyl-ACP methyl ester carboxylesterase
LLAEADDRGRPCTSNKITRLGDPSKKEPTMKASIRRADVATVKGSLPGPAGGLYADDGGDGGVGVVFVHAFAGSSRDWFEQLEHLRPHRRAVAFDLRGHGHSDPPRRLDYSIAGFASDVAAVVDGLDLRRFYLVGHSLGGVAAIEYAGHHSERVAGLVLCGTPGRSSPEQARQIMTAMRTDYENVNESYWKKLLSSARPEVEQHIRNELVHVPRDAALAIIEAVFAYDPEPALRAYRGPKLLIETTTSDSPGSLHQLAPEIPREVIEGTSHWMFMDEPEEFDRILDEFLEHPR